jgi:hypothetical protein
MGHVETKTCGTCHEIKPVQEFAVKRGAWSSKCKACHNAYYKEYWKNSEAYEKHKVRITKNRRERRLARYGMTKEQQAAGLAGLCQLCQTNQATVLDHCHKTGDFRGFLCGTCNTGLGKLGDSVDGLRRAMLYLENNGARLAGGQK